MLAAPLSRCGIGQGCERGVILPVGLARRGTHHELVDLVFAEPRRPHCGNVLVRDFVGLDSDFVDQRAQRRIQPCVVERGAPLGPRRPAVSFEETCVQYFVRRPLFFVESNLFLEKVVSWDICFRCSASLS